MSESGQRTKVVRNLRALHAIPVENRVHPGTPDVNYADGWLELKWLRAWPKGEDTIVQLPHFTPIQRRWLNRRWLKSGSAWLLLQVKREWLLFNGSIASEYVGLVTRAGLYGCARVRWTNGLKGEELRECLERDWESWDGLPLVNGCSLTAADVVKLSHRPLRGTV